MPEAIDRLARNINDIAATLTEIKAGDIRCLGCGYTAPEAEFRSGQRLNGGTGHELHRYCPKCNRSIDWAGYLHRDAAGVLRRAA